MIHRTPTDAETDTRNGTLLILLGLSALRDKMDLSQAKGAQLGRLSIPAQQGVEAPLQTVRITNARVHFRAGLMVIAKRISKNQLTLPRWASWGCWSGWPR